MARFLKTAIPLLVIIALLGIVLCHNMSGPFTVVNGPSTAFLSLKHATIVHFALTTVLVNVVAMLASLAACRDPLALTEPAPASSTVLQEFCALLC
jgi:hypothetical protein